MHIDLARAGGADARAARGIDTARADIDVAGARIDRAHARSARGDRVRHTDVDVAGGARVLDIGPHAIALGGIDLRGGANVLFARRGPVGGGVNAHKIAADIAGLDVHRPAGRGGEDAGVAGADAAIGSDVHAAAAVGVGHAAVRGRIDEAAGVDVDLTGRAGGPGIDAAAAIGPHIAGRDADLARARVGPDRAGVRGVDGAGGDLHIAGRGPAFHPPGHTIAAVGAGHAAHRDGHAASAGGRRRHAVGPTVHVAADIDLDVAARRRGEDAVAGRAVHIAGHLDGDGLGAVAVGVDAVRLAARRAADADIDIAAGRDGAHALIGLARHNTVGVHGDRARACVAYAHDAVLGARHLAGRVHIDVARSRAGEDAVLGLAVGSAGGDRHMARAHVQRIDAVRSARGLAAGDDGDVAGVGRVAEAREHARAAGPADRAGGVQIDRARARDLGIDAVLAAADGRALDRDRAVAVDLGEDAVTVAAVEVLALDVDVAGGVGVQIGAVARALDRAGGGQVDRAAGGDRVHARALLAGGVGDVEVDLAGPGREGHDAGGFGGDVALHEDAGQAVLGVGVAAVAARIDGRGGVARHQPPAGPIGIGDHAVLGRADGARQDTAPIGVADDHVAAAAFRPDRVAALGGDAARGQHIDTAGAARAPDETGAFFF